MKGIKHRETEIDGYEDGIPVVLCDTKLVNRKFWVAPPGAVSWCFYCQYCRHYHTHSPMPGHRLAHCAGDTPFKQTGYILKLRTKQLVGG